MQRPTTRTPRLPFLLLATLASVSTLMDACCPAPPPVAPCPRAQHEPQPSTSLVVDKGPEWLIEDFESPSGLSGGMWLEFDKNPLGTAANPSPFVLAEGGRLGSDSSPGPA